MVSPMGSLFVWSQSPDNGGRAVELIVGLDCKETKQMTQPLIGISMSREEKSDIPARDWVRRTYIVAIIEAGGIPVLLPNEPSSSELLRQCHGLLLTGGGDFDPATFGAANQGTEMASVSTARDTTELGLIRVAEELNMPIFGICRGLQALTVAGGGSLIQDLPSARPDSQIRHNQSEPRVDVTHRVTVDSGTRLAEILQGNSLSVNSFHHQAIERVPEGYVVTAHSDDGIIEAIEDPQAMFRIGVQWHPEDLQTHRAEAKNLFSTFVQAAGMYQGRGQ